MKYRFTREHKSVRGGVGAPAHGIMAVRRSNGYRDLSFEGAVTEIGDMVYVGDHDPVLRLEVDAQGLQFLLDNLPEDDLFTEYLQYAREIAAVRMYERAERG